MRFELVIAFVLCVGCGGNVVVDPGGGGHPPTASAAQAGGGGATNASVVGSSTSSGILYCVDDPTACPAGFTCACGGPGPSGTCFCAPNCTHDSQCSGGDICCAHFGACTDSCTCDCL